jgi:hypothetical protein
LRSLLDVSSPSSPCQSSSNATLSLPSSYGATATAATGTNANGVNEVKSERHVSQPQRTISPNSDGHDESPLLYDPRSDMTYGARGAEVSTTFHLHTIPLQCNLCEPCVCV